MFLCVEPDVVHAAGTPCSITPVLTEADLNTCVAEAPTDNSEFAITIGADFNITAQKNIVAGKNITLTSVDPSNPATLTRGPSFVGRLFNSNTASVAVLTIDSIIIDGNNPIATTNNQLVFTAGTGDVTINLIGNTVLKNNNSTSRGCAISLEGANHKLDIQDNVQITNNTSTASGAGIYSVGAINMTGGTISYNTGYRGGGIYMDSGTSQLFNMTNSAISNNTATDNGGGIYIANGILNLNSGAIISNNIASNSGGGIRMTGGTQINMYAGSAISGNTAGNNGGGASIINIFNLYGGEINGNTAGNGGGGVSVQGIGTAKLNIPAGSTGVISGNSASVGGGVRIDEAISNILDMAGGTISNNAADNGGGVYVGSGTANIVSGNVVGNIANVDGGGVYTEDYGNLTVGANAIFSANRAATSSPTRDPAYDAVYATNILGTNWTTPFTQGYNNYDINHDYAPEAPGTGSVPSGLGNDAVSLMGFGCAVVTIIIGAIFYVSIPLRSSRR